MAFTPIYRTGELSLREGQHDPTVSRQSARPNYAPDNRKIPPQPPQHIGGDPEDSDTPSTTELTTAIGAEPNVLVNPDGSVDHGVIVTFTVPNWWGPASRYDVYAADENDFVANCFARVGSILAGDQNKGNSYLVSHPYFVRGRTYTIAVCPANADGAHIEPRDAPQVSVTLTGTGVVPPDVTGFTVTNECCDLDFAWTPVTDTNNDVRYYEIRQGASFVAGTLVARVWGWGVGRAFVKLAQIPNALSAPDDEFHIKAITGLNAESATEASDTLTAEEIGGIQSFCCVVGVIQAATAGVDTITGTTIMPIVGGGGPPIIGVSPNAQAVGGGLGGWVVESSIVANGNRFDYTIQLDDIPVAGESVNVTEAVGT